MGRAFEFRKERKFKRWAKMAVQFTRLGKEIAIAVKEGGPNPEGNSRLRTAIQNGKAVNMPKDRIEAAIKRASDKDAKGYEEHVYEGYGPHGVPVLIETATDNTNRTVANIRSYFSKAGGTLGKTGSLDFIFQRKSIFRFIVGEDIDLEELELELIDGGLEELYVEADEEGNDVVVAQTSFEDFGNMQRLLEEKGIEIKSANLERIALSNTEVSEEDAAEVLKLIDKIEEDDDVQAVYHNMG
ncbi:YebC/PmpR family DNA-binding transcriptional regulator [Parapedobacter indicus]|uniref:Probable transcriptional regulatory protein SAMN05444682_108273 n=1 Tax=Parapedobacter indicus TaxID=1477437 RepID=A0A1I3Q634_9SPHI|nr:YebC/PmpR family DNA-binding transcriptional regulator [Parapedobacter indicus]PPL00682.1 YebC/PmpR family DNA-binding regulatory protein [Parapedobacter indicus]SFJ29135.1 DNA-binding regulatory protein, YebC/PmpR family [Parapedobacter indicus]